MAPAVERREHGRRMSPAKSRHSPPRRSSPRREKSPARQRSPEKERSPKRVSSPHRRSSAKEKLSDRKRSPERGRGRSPVRTSSSRSPCPRTKRLRRAEAEKEPVKVKSEERVKSSRREPKNDAEKEYKERKRSSPSHSPSPRSKRLMHLQAERDAEKSKEREHSRNSSWEEHDKRKHAEQGESRDTHRDRRSGRDKNEGGSSKSSRHDSSVTQSRGDRSGSPEHNHRSKPGSYSPSRHSSGGAREEVSKSRASQLVRDDDLDSVAKMKVAEESLDAKEKDKQKPSFELSGKLAEETNRVRGVTLLFNEPPDARKPDIRWRLYVFKAGEVLKEPLYIHRQSCYLFGRERRVADIPTDHPSCSKQHAAIQYRLVEKELPDGLLSKQSRICYAARELKWLNNPKLKTKHQRRHYSGSVAILWGQRLRKLMCLTLRWLFADCCFLLCSLRKLAGSSHVLLLLLVPTNKRRKSPVLCMNLFVTLVSSLPLRQQCNHLNV